VLVVLLPLYLFILYLFHPHFFRGFYISLASVLEIVADSAPSRRLFRVGQSSGRCPSLFSTMSWTSFLLGFLSSSQGVRMQGFTRRAHAPVVQILDCMSPRSLHLSSSVTCISMTLKTRDDLIFFCTTHILYCALCVLYLPFVLITMGSCVSLCSSSRDLRWFFWVNFGFDLPLAAVRSAAHRHFAMNFRCV
jgi:hypothetical protein